MRISLHQLGALLVALALVLGAVGHGAGAAQMTGRMQAASAGGASGPDGCDAGGGGHGMSSAMCHAICHAICSPLLAIVPVPMPAVAAAAAAIRPAVFLPRSGRTIPPDPSPPRSAVLI